MSDIDRATLIALFGQGLIRCKSCERRPATRCFDYRYEHGNGEGQAQWPCCPDLACAQEAHEDGDVTIFRERPAPYGAALTHFVASLTEDEIALLDAQTACRSVIDFWDRIHNYSC